MTARWDTPALIAASGFATIAAALGLLAGINPLAAIGASLALALVLLVFTDLAAGLAAFTIIVFLEYILAGGPLLSITKAAGVLLAAAWFARVASSGERDTYLTAHPTASYLLLAFLGWGVVSLTWSDDTGTTLLELSRYLLVMVLFVIVYSAVRSRRDAGLVFGAFLVGTVFTAVYGLLDRPSVDPAEVQRVSSTVGDPNVLASILVAGLVLAIGSAAALRGSPALRLAAIGVAILCMVSFVYTGSRGGVVSLAAVLVVAVLVAGRWRPQVLLGAAGVAVGTVLLFAAFAPMEIKDRISETSPGQLRGEEGRFTLWEVGWRMFEDEPLHGVGMGSFQASSIDYVLRPGTLARTDQVIDTPKVAHNIYLQALAELGVAGSVLFVAIYGFPIGCALAAARNFSRLGSRDLEIMARALVIALAGILAANFFVSEHINKQLWLLLGMGPALLAISTARLRSLNRQRDRRRYAGIDRIDEPQAPALSRS